MMNDREKQSTASFLPDAGEGIRRIIVQQYLLHEITHHSLHGKDFTGTGSLVPKAHSLVDIYKCLHQSEFGVGHAIDDPNRFKQRLLLELEANAPGDRGAAPLFENLRPDGRVLRANLRPLQRRMGGDAEKLAGQLAHVCSESARITRGSPKNFFAALMAFKNLNAAGQLCLGDYIFAFPDGAVERFLVEIREWGHRLRQIPIFSHSKAYRYLNRPAYRVVDRSVLENSPLSFLLEKDESAHHDI